MNLNRSSQEELIQLVQQKDKLLQIRNEKIEYQSRRMQTLEQEKQQLEVLLQMERDALRMERERSSLERSMLQKQVSRYHAEIEAAATGAAQLSAESSSSSSQQKFQTKSATPANKEDKQEAAEAKGEIKEELQAQSSPEEPASETSRSIPADVMLTDSQAPSEGSGFPFPRTALPVDEQQKALEAIVPAFGAHAHETSEVVSISQALEAIVPALGAHAHETSEVISISESDDIDYVALQQMADRHDKEIGADEHNAETFPNMQIEPGSRAVGSFLGNDLKEVGFTSPTNASNSQSDPQSHPLSKSNSSSLLSATCEAGTCSDRTKNQKKTKILSAMCQIVANKGGKCNAGVLYRELHDKNPAFKDHVKKIGGLRAFCEGPESQGRFRFDTANGGHVKLLEDGREQCEHGFDDPRLTRMYVLLFELQSRFQSKAWPREKKELWEEKDIFPWCGPAKTEILWQLTVGGYLHMNHGSQLQWNHKRIQHAIQQMPNSFKKGVGSTSRKSSRTLGVIFESANFEGAPPDSELSVSSVWPESCPTVHSLLKSDADCAQRLCVYMKDVDTSEGAEGAKDLIERETGVTLHLLPFPCRHPGSFIVGCKTMLDAQALLQAFPGQAMPYQQKGYLRARSEVVESSRNNKKTPPIGGVSSSCCWPGQMSVKTLTQLNPQLAEKLCVFVTGIPSEIASEEFPCLVEGWARTTLPVNPWATTLNEGTRIATIGCIDELAASAVLQAVRQSGKSGMFASMYHRQKKDS